MKNLLFALSLVMLIAGWCFAGDNQYYPGPQTKENVYGPGIHQDAYGRPFQYQTQQGNQVLGPVKRDGYGLGIHQDQYGRPVQESPWPNWKK
jgi:hypothetical protein